MASSRYRVYGWAQIISQMGYEVRIIFQCVDFSRKNNFFKNIIFLLKIIFFSKKAKIIVFHKYLPPIFIQKFLKKKKIIFDFDDRIYTEDVLTDKKSRINSFLNIANRIIVSVPIIRDEIIMCLPSLSKKIIAIPTLIDTAKITKDLKDMKDNKQKSIVKIGWIGTSSGLKYLSLIEEALHKLIYEFKGKVIFFVISDKSFTPKSFPFQIKNIKWSLKDEYNYFNNLDISVMPLDDSKRAKSKAGFKVIQSMAAGVPVIASSIGFNKDIICHGENGFLAESFHDFYKYLKQLILDEKIHHKMAINAREAIKKFDYNYWKESYLKQVLF